MMRPALKTHWVVLAALLWAVFYYGSVSAMPAPNFLITVTQPDGTPIQIRLFGDEWYSWAETEDGYTVIQDEDGWWRYAQLDEKGRFIPSDIEVSPKGVRKSAEIQFTKGLRKHLRESQEVVQERCEEMHLKPFQFNPRLSYREGEVPITNNILLILVDYPDLPHTETIESFGDMMGQENYDGTGSFNQYYREISYDKFGVTATVVGWYTAPNPHGYYGWERDSLTQSLNRVHELVAWAVQQADASVNFLQFDNDTNGVVDGLFLVHAGPGAEEGDSRNIWSHRHFLHWHYGDDRRFADGDTIDEYVIVPEKFETGHARIGTYCHEYGHVLGLPDLYDPDGSSYGIGYWGLMGLGGWGGDGEHPETPSHMCAWSKIKLGWVSPDVPTEDRIGQFILNVEENQQILKLWTNGDPSEEYFLAENRDTIKFDQHLPGCGLLIWHIDETAVDEWGRLSNQDENRRAVDLEAADGDEDMDYRQNEGDDGDPFPGAKGNQTFNASSNPNSRDYRGHNTYVEVKIMSSGCNPILADLKVSGPPGSPDLVIRDCPADVGVEPDIWCMDDFVSSPDIWIDNDGDGQPDPFGPGVVNRVWARIWNIGSAPATDVRVSFWRAEPTLGLRFPDNAARIVDHITGDSAVSVGLIPGNQTPGSGPGTVVSIDALLPEPPYCMGVIAENDEDLQTSISPLDDNNLAQLNLWSLRQRSVPGEQTVIASAITAANPTDRWRCFEIVVDGSLLPLDWDAWAEPESLDLDPGEELPVTLWVIAPVGAAHGDTGVVFADLFECGELDTSLGAVVIDVGIDNVPPDTVEDLTAMRLCPEGDDFSTDLYTVQLTWSPVQKDVAGNSEEIRLYYIHRDTTEGFEPDSTNLVDSTAADADTLLPDFQWKDRPDLTPPTFAAKSIASGNIKYYYKVASVDRAGNLSAPSNEASPRRVSCDSCVVQLTHSFTGEAAYDELGYSVSGAGDVNGDGFDDLIVGAPLNDAGGPDAGRAYLYSGTTGALLYTLPGGGPGDHFGWSVSGAGDVNDDGYADLIVGAPLNDAGGADAGRAYIYSGATGTLLYPFTGQAAGDWLGVSVSGAGDVNNDGYADLIVGAPLNDAGSTDAGRVYIYSGATGALLYTFTGEAAVDQLGSSVSGAGDVNNDGCDDLIVGAPLNDAGGPNAGRAYVYSGATGALLYTFTGEAVEDNLGGSVSGAGDVNGDGYADLIVGAYPNDAGGNYAGRVYVFFGGTDLFPVEILAADADLIFTGEAAGDLFGWSVSGAGDVNKDGYADLIVGASGNDAAGAEAGGAYVFFGGPVPFPAQISAANADLIFTGEAAYDRFGVSVSGAGDVNNDGSQDLIVGADLNDARGTWAGRAYVYGCSPDCGLRCDDNNDGVINILDVIAEVNCILGIEMCSPNSCRLWRADCNCDGVLNIIDVIAKVNCILGIGPCPPCTRMAKTPSGPARIYTPEIDVSPGGKGKGMKPKAETGFRLPIYLETEEEVCGLQFKLSYDAAALTLGEPQLAERCGQMTVASNVKDGELIMVVYSPEGKTIPAGTGPVLTMPFEMADSRWQMADCGLIFKEVILAGSGCQAIPVEVQPISLKSSLLPETWSLEQNYPNPFNPNTQIRFQIPSLASRPSSFVSLKIYNILGQEVRTLVDEAKGPGYYTVTWDGRDDFGREVASGIYFYRLSAGGTFTAAKRMVLMK